MTEFAFLTTIVIIILVGYWSLVVFPKQRDYKKHIDYVERLKEGDEVITYGGLIGTIAELNDDIGIARLKLAEGVEVRIVTAAIQQSFDPDEIRRNIHLAGSHTHPE
jgi:preprotein translocase subunit YajC